MDLDTFIITTFCINDDTVNDILQHRRLRQRGPKLSLSDSEVLTIVLMLNQAQGNPPLKLSKLLNGKLAHRVIYLLAVASNIITSITATRAMIPALRHKFACSNTVSVAFFCLSRG